MLKKIKKYLVDKAYRFSVNSDILGLYNRCSDYDFIRKKYYSVFEKELDYEKVITFNQKLQWLKLNDRRIEYTTMVDKYAVKEYVADKIGKQYIIPTLGVWDNPEKIKFNSLPNKFVLKCTHNSGLGMYICEDKSKINISKVKRNLWRGLKQNYYLTGREWPYKNVNRKIIAEQYLSDASGNLNDYKVHCFNGKPYFILVCQDRFKESGMIEDFYTTKWEWIPVKRPKIKNSEIAKECPRELEELLELSEELSKDIPFVRVDFYIVNHQIYFSELTLFPASGFEKFEPDEWDFIFGEYLKLPSK